MYKLTILTLLIQQTLLKNIGIVGCGVGGAAAAHFLKNHNVTIFESTSQCGGRTNFIHVDGYGEIEMGGTFFIEENRYFKEFIELTGHTYSIRTGGEGDNSIGIFDKSNKITFELGNYKIINLIKLIYEFGMDPLKLERLAKEKLGGFANIYDFLESGQSFTSFDQYQQIIGLDGKFRVKLVDFLNQNGISSGIADNLLSGLISSIYNQDYTDINAIAGIVSIIASFEKSYAVDHGNRIVFDDLVRMDSIKTKFNTKVNAINQYGDKYIVKFEEADAQLQQEFDVVILATLVTSNTQIKFDNKVEQIFKLINDEHKHQVYIIDFYNKKNAFVYLITGVVNLDYFDIAAIDLLPRFLLSKDIHNTLIGELYVICHDCKNGQGLYKVQTQTSILGDLNKIFIQHEVIQEVKWLPAYPVLGTQKIDLPIILNDNFYFINSMEYVASCMELQMIAAKNIANKIDDFIQKQTKNDL